VEDKVRTSAGEMGLAVEVFRYRFQDYDGLPPAVALSGTQFIFSSNFRSNFHAARLSPLAARAGILWLPAFSARPHPTDFIVVVLLQT
jgi:hypothetical protein